jgi:hypothetical protein
MVPDLNVLLQLCDQTLTEMLLLSAGYIGLRCICCKRSARLASLLCVGVWGRLGTRRDHKHWTSIRTSIQGVSHHAFQSVSTVLVISSSLEFLKGPLINIITVIINV